MGGIQLTVEPLPPEPSDATTARVFRHVAAYYGQEAHRALAGMCINLGSNMIAVARTLQGAAGAIEKAAISRVPLGAVDLELLRDADAAVERLLGWLKHEPLDACRRELARRQTLAAAPPPRSDIEEIELARGATDFLRGKTEFHPTPLSDQAPRPTPARYLVAELEPTIWRIPFELPLDDLAQAFEAFAERAKLHVAMYGEPRPMILLDRQTDTILRSASDATPAAATTAADVSVWLEEGQPDPDDRCRVSTSPWE